MRPWPAFIPLLALAACESLPRASDPSGSAEHHELAEHDSDHDGDHHDDGDDDHDHDHDATPLPSDPGTVAAAARVRVLQGGDMGCESEALGPVDVHSPMHGTDKALEALKLRAAALGADAVVGVDFHHGEGGHAPTHLSGMAARCKDLLKGRSYDVIASLDVPGKMGREKDAFEDLLHKAWLAKADLVVDIEFHHGDGTEPTHMTGTAVRFRPKRESPQ